MPRYVLTDNERELLQNYLSGAKPDTHTHVILSRLRKLQISRIFEDFLLLEKVFKRLTET